MQVEIMIHGTNVKYAIRSGNMTDLSGATGTTTLPLSPRKCKVCLEDLPQIDPFYTVRSAHDQCLVCPYCKSDFVIWQFSSPQQRSILRCLNCLHRWEGKPHG